MVHICVSRWPRLFSAKPAFFSETAHLSRRRVESNTFFDAFLDLTLVLLMFVTVVVEVEEKIMMKIEALPGPDGRLAVTTVYPDYSSLLLMPASLHCETHLLSAP